MGKHAAHNIADNSLEAYFSILNDMPKRRAIIFRSIAYYGPSTDRMIMKRLGYSELNSVRPRITEMINDNVLIQIGSQVDAWTNRTVRIVDIHPELKTKEG